MSKAAKLALLSGFLGWMFDSMDLNLFTLVLVPTIKELTGAATPSAIASAGGIVVGLKIFGWGLGGVIFGVVADRIGRSRTLVLTILIYSVFTALCGFVQNFWQLAVLQTLAGIGIGGEWAAGAALIAETWPERTRVKAMQIMQMAYAIGFFLAAGVNIFLGPFGWRVVLMAGIVPAVATLFIRAFVPEPERWIAARVTTKGESAVATFTAIFTRDHIRNTIVGVTIAFAMTVGSWAALTLLPAWISQLLGPSTPAIATWTISWSFILMNFGAVAGYGVLILFADRIGRRLSYFIFCTGSLISIVYTFRDGTTLPQLQIMLPVLGFFILGGFGNFAAYLPELFPTRIRATGQGFCYNMSRLLTSPGPLIVGSLVGTFGGSIPRASSMVGLTLLLGMVAIWFGPETAGKPLRD